MPRPLLPPRGVHVPARMINPLLPPAERSLRGLAWGGMVTPPLRSQELAALTGKRQALVFRHMSQLRYIAALSWVATGQGKIIVSGAVQASIIKGGPVIPKKIPDSKNLESLPLLNPHSSSSLIPVIDSGVQESNQVRRNDVNGGDGGGRDFPNFWNRISRFLESDFGSIVPPDSTWRGVLSFLSFLQN